MTDAQTPEPAENPASDATPHAEGALEPSERKGCVLLGVSALVFVLLVAGATFWYRHYLSPAATTATVPASTAAVKPAAAGTVPDVVGSSQSAASSALQTAGYLPLPTIVVTTTVGVGTVVAQAPSSGAAAAAGSQIAFAVAAPSAPAAAANVPSVYLLKKADAQSLLMSSGFVPVFAESPSQEAAGVAFSQLPSSLDSAALGTTVVVVVSNGHVPQPAALAVPSVVGKTLADATAALNSASLQWQSLSGFNAAPKDQVFAQLPPAGGQVAAETPVLLVVSLGTLPNAGQNVVIPDVTQMDFSAARDALLAAGLPVQQADVAGGQSGKIVGQVPPAGWSVPAGTVVVVSVATAK